MVNALYRGHNLEMSLRTAFRVETDERMNWIPSPNRRQYFLENSKYDDTPDNFDENSDVYTLFNIFCDWINTESDVRKKIHLLNSARSLIYELGTSDGYIRIAAYKNNQKLCYYIPYLSNRESIDYLYQMLKDELINIPNDKDCGYQPIYYDRCKCRCNRNSSVQFTNMHPGSISINLRPKQKILVNSDQIIEKLIQLDALKILLEQQCPYYYLNNIDNLMELVDNI